jgi:light-regulated signal transduction histidine kinase (bacteriophytochrome)
VRSHLACALGPPHGPPCLLALHRCGDEGRWSSEDIDLLRDLSHRLEDLLGACYLLEEVRGSEELLHQAVADLERSNADLESFAYLASHDLKEPLRAVANSVQLLLRRFIDPSNTEATRLAQHAVSGAFRMTELVDGLLEYSRVGTQPLAIGPVDLAAALRGVLLDLGPRIEEAEALVVPGSLPVVQGEERMLRQVLQNLLSNALKFRGSAPLVVRFSAVRSGSLWTITVQDNGAGFAVQDARRIFNVFETLNGGGGGLGTGLGLALCKRIIQRLGGSIWAEGEPGTGATFHFTLPGADREAESPGSAEGHEDLY